MVHPVIAKNMRQFPIEITMGRMAGKYGMIGIGAIPLHNWLIHQTSSADLASVGAAGRPSPSLGD